MSWIAANGSMNVTVVPGTAYTGRVAPNGSMYVVESTPGIFAGGAHPCGAMNVSTVIGPVTSSVARNGSLNISVSPFQTGTRYVTKL